MKKTIVFIVIYFCYCNILLFAQITKINTETKLDTIKNDELDTTIELIDDTILQTIGDSLIQEDDTAIITTNDIITQPIISKKSKYDTIINQKNEKIVVHIKNSNEKEITFVYPLNTVLNTIRKSTLKEVIYSSGYKEIFINIASQETATEEGQIIINGVEDWEKVNVTYDPVDIEGLVEKGVVKATAIGSKIKTPSYLLENNAAVVIKKRTARLGAHIVLIKKNKVNRSYGELPSAELEGIAYGYE